MQCVTILLATIFFELVCTISGSSPCGCLEEPATGNKRRDKYCRPHLVPKLERQKRRDCICRPGFVRNSWGDCITKKECMHCKCHPNKDFNVCARACPVICNEPIRTSCSKECVFGCDCPPGFVRDRKKKNRCVKATKCALKCPAHSKFQFCVSTCAPKCGRRTSGTCATRCQRGGCVCDQGYAEVEHNGNTICVPRGECYRYTVGATSLHPGGHGLVGGRITSAGMTGGITARTVGTVSSGSGIIRPGTGSGMTVSMSPGFGGTSGGALLPGGVQRPSGAIKINDASSGGTYRIGSLSGGIDGVTGGTTGPYPTQPGANTLSTLSYGTDGNGVTETLPGAGAGGAVGGGIVEGGANLNARANALTSASAVSSNVDRRRTSGNIGAPIAGAVLGGLAVAGVSAIAGGLTGMGDAGHRVGRPCVGTRCGASAIPSGGRGGCVRCNMRNWG
ncbi:zonadhesin-like [Rhipicephalus sanguineus]|uniref:zonadhesin-like n=1 Tax=Rhipicephalus sanguineus TaxID=34632 RepID=UPI0018960B49|nr:zonadhesin-like [Rhipicephalus sanguineus]